MRILPSQSRGTKRKVGSTWSLVMVRSRPWRSRDRRPVGDARAAERVDAEAQPAVADDGEVDDGGQVVDVGRDVVVAVDAVAVLRALDVAQLVLQQRVGLALHPAGDVGVGRPAVGRVVLHAAVLGRVVRRGDDDAVGLAGAAAAVVGQDRVRDRRRGREAVVGVDHRRRRRGRRAPPRCSAPRARRARACRAPGRAGRRCPAPGDSGRSPRLIASTWASLNVRAVDVPRCPEVPKATRCASTDGSGRSSK